MRTILAVLLMIAALITPSFANENDYDPNIMILPLGTTIANAAATSPFVKVPNRITIVKVEVVDAGGIAKDATDTAIVTVLDDGNTVTSHTTATTALVAKTPLAMTVSASAKRIDKDSLVGVELTKGASGKATTNMCVVITYFNGW